MTPHLPQPGHVVRVRHRSWLVNQVKPGDRDGDATLVKLSCIDPDAAGDHLEVLWEMELGAEVVPDQPGLLDEAKRKLDEPRMFGAYLNALRWSCVTSTDKRLLQAPFRAGIDLKAYQLEPLRKALELPRVNLFIADDVGLGKTIEAGLIMQELILRQRIDQALVIAPPSVTLQWQEEMEQRFGLFFQIYDRHFVTARRRERGWGVNPWTTYPRFIVSTALLRGQRTRKRKGIPRTQHLELLLNALGKRAERSLLILDEAHQAAPSSGSLYAIDSRTTRAIRQVASRFEHRLFLSATPHNGHSNSFSALLELLDPQRFTRGVNVKSVKELAPVLVRRLKRDLRQEVGGLPKRVLVDHTINLSPEAPEVRLGNLLAEYEDAYRASLSHLSASEQAARGLVCINLHKRLLSSIEAFARTLEVHARSAEERLDELATGYLPEAPSRSREDDPEFPTDRPLTDEELDDREDEYVAQATVNPPADALSILTEMRDIAGQYRAEPDARLEELARWIRENLFTKTNNENSSPDNHDGSLDGGSGGETTGSHRGTWNDRRVVIFTEYNDTLRWLHRTLPLLLNTPDIDGRIERYHGGMGDQRRDELKRAFNMAPSAHRLRILLATDAAREGINLQAHCYDLFHFDLPWNPARVEQRNGRIDRTLQPNPEVYCHYFDLPDRPENRVLAHMVKKIDVIAEELGSLSDVLSSRLAARMESGIRGLTEEDVDTVMTPDDKALEAAKELEGRYSEDAELLRGDLEVLERQLDRSRRQMDYHVDHLRDAVDLGLDIACNDGLEKREPPSDPPAYDLPVGALDASWSSTLSTMREPMPEDAERWHVPPVRPVAFRAAHRLDADTVQLHLGHPFVKRLLTRFQAQGFANHDLSRVTVLEAPDESTRRVVAFGKLSLFGHGATRLHEEIVPVAARWSADKDLSPYKEDATRNAVEILYERLKDGPPMHPDEAVRRQALGAADQDFSQLWPHLSAMAELAQGRAEEALLKRGDQEAGAMVELLERQLSAIRDALSEGRQRKLEFEDAVREEREQFERDQRHMEGRLEEISEELVHEPAAIRRSYEVVLHRFEPVGMVYLWP